MHINVDSRPCTLVTNRIVHGTLTYVGVTALPIKHADNIIIYVLGIDLVLYGFNKKRSYATT